MKNTELWIVYLKKMQFLAHLGFRGQGTGKKLDVSYEDKRNDFLSQIFILMNEVNA